MFPREIFFFLNCTADCIKISFFANDHVHEKFFVICQGYVTGYIFVVIENA